MADRPVILPIDEISASKYVKKPCGFLDREDPAQCRFTHASLSLAFALHRQFCDEAADDQSRLVF